MSWTTPANVELMAPPTLKLPAVEKIQAYIDNVERQINHYYPRITDRITNSDITVEYIIDGVTRIIIEYVATGGSPYQQETQTYGSAVSRTTMFDGSARKNLLLSEEDLAYFGPRINDRAYMIDISRQGRPLLTTLPVAPQNEPWLVNVPWTN